MIPFLNAGFGEPLSPDDLDLIFGLAFQGIRTDVKAAMQYHDVAAIVANALYKPGARAIFVCETERAPELGGFVARAARALSAQDRVIVEVGNEEDGEPEWRERPADFGRLVANTARAMWVVDSGVRVISGGTRSTSVDALQWLGQAVPHMPRDVGVGYHTYRSGSPNEPLPGFRSRGDEFARLREAAGGRPIWNTEVGWSTAPRSKSFPLCWHKTRLTNEQVNAYLKAELNINRAAGAESVCIYQLQDAEPETNLNRFGIRTSDGVLKPQATVLL